MRNARVETGLKCDRRGASDVVEPKGALTLRAAE